MVLEIILGAITIGSTLFGLYERNKRIKSDKELIKQRLKLALTEIKSNNRLRLQLLQSESAHRNSHSIILDPFKKDFIVQLNQTEYLFPEKMIENIPIYVSRLDKLNEHKENLRSFYVSGKDHSGNADNLYNLLRECETLFNDLETEINKQMDEII